MKNLHAINKLDKWTHLFTAFKEQRELDPWYPVPALENPKDVLIELTEPSVAPNTLKINLAIDSMCQGKGLYLSICVEGIPEKIIKIGKEDLKQESIEVLPEIYPELGDRKITIKVFNKKDRIIYNS